LLEDKVWVLASECERSPVKGKNAENRRRFSIILRLVATIKT